MQLFAQVKVAKKATVAAAKIWGPIYLRFAREKTPVITTEETPFTPGKAMIYWQSKKPEVAILACGQLVYQALVAARELEKEKIGSMVLNVSSIKPLDELAIYEAAKKCGAVVAIEEHQIHGGMGGAIAEFLSAKFPVPMEFVGMRDTFGESGEPNELLEKYGMSVSHIRSAAKKAIKRK